MARRVAAPWQNLRTFHGAAASIVITTRLIPNSPVFIVLGFWAFVGAAALSVLFTFRFEAPPLHRWRPNPLTPCRRWVILVAANRPAMKELSFNQAFDRNVGL
jgi:hypothetical protein